MTDTSPASDTISVIGLGKLGASMVAAIASRGLPVIGLDVNAAAVEAVKNGKAPVQETDLDTTLSANRERIRATMSMEEAVAGSSLSFVIVPTPSDDRGAFSLKFAASACAEIGRALKTKTGYHLVVLTSTVLPGSCRAGLIPILEAESGKRCGADFGFCYSPEFIALGSILKNFLNPDFTLVGEFDARSGDTLEAAYKKIMRSDPPCRRMTLENAELAKVALNAFVTTKITFANTLAEICQTIPGGDVDVVTNAIGLDTRIGKKYLTGALGYGGPCFPRDNVALAFFAKAMGTEAPLSETTDRVNRNLARLLTERMDRQIPAGSTAAILGLAYKPDSHVLEESQGIALAKALLARGVKVKAFDPLLAAMNKKEIPDGVALCDSVASCLRAANAVLITTPDAAFKSLDEAAFSSCASGCTVVDFWRILKDKLLSAKSIRYVPYGCADETTGCDRLTDLW